jgi:hypothetical protein
VAVSVLGCAPATIYRCDDRPLEAIIESSDATSLRVRDPDGNHFVLGQEQVADVDHPGNVGVVVGLVLTGLGLAYLVGTSGRTDAGSSNLRQVGFAFVGLGVVDMILGGAAWTHSRLAARPFNQGRPAQPPPRAQLP